MARGAQPLPAPNLAARLAAEGLPPVLLLAGPEEWFRDQGLLAALRVAFPEGDPGGGVVRRDAAADKAVGALEEWRGGGLYSPRVVVVVDHAEQVEPPAGGDGRQAALTRFVLRALEAPPATGHLVLRTAYGVKGRQSVSTEKLLQAGAWVVDCRALYDAPAPWEPGPPHDHELSRFLVRRMREAWGKRLGLADAHALARRTGNQLAALDDALRSLALYVGGRAAVEAADVEAAVGATSQDGTFEFADRVLGADPADALAALEAAFERGVSVGRGRGSVTQPDALFHVLVDALGRKLHALLRAAEALARGEPGPEVARAQGVPGPRVEAFLAAARRPLGPLLRGNEALLDAELGVKGGGVPPRIALERLVWALAAAGR